MSKPLTHIKSQLFLAFERFRLIMSVEGNGLIRLLIGMAGLTWFVLLIDPTTLFTDSRTTYLVMRYFASEQIWALWFAISGFLGIYTVLFGVRSRFWLVSDAVLSAFLWSTSTLACFAAHWPAAPIGDVLGQLRAYAPPAAMSGEAWLSVAAWWCALRRITDVYVDDILQ